MGDGGVSAPFTIVYITNRPNPRFDWFADGLCAQANGDFPEVVVVDLCCNNEGRKEQLHEAVRGRFQFKHCSEKPTVWQGKHRLTKTDWFAAANARNTGACLASTPYIVYVDDLSIFCRGWMDNVRDAAHHRYIVCGAYKKVEELIVEGGFPVSWKEVPGGNDCRLGQGSDAGRVRTHGGNMFGCSFGISVDDYLAVNGNDEIFDGTGYEDTNLGIRLEKSGRQLWYNRNMMTLEDGPAHSQGPIMKREDWKSWGTHAQPQSADAVEIIAKMTAENPYGRAQSYGDMQALKGKTLAGPDVSHIFVNLTRMRPGVRSIGNHYDLAQVRQMVLGGGSFPPAKAPTVRWCDGFPLSEM